MIIRELAVVRYIENNEFTDEDMVDIAHTYSKDIEHLEENIEALAELFETNDVFDIEEMVIALMNQNIVKYLLFASTYFQEKTFFI